jgi:hypothetical protein
MGVMPQKQHFVIDLTPVRRILVIDLTPMIDICGYSERKKWKVRKVFKFLLDRLGDRLFS